MKHSRNGFTLIEMAIVLAIITLLLGGLIAPLSSQMEQRNITETQKSLGDIKEALLGYALIYGYLPCPATETDPANANYGVANASCPPNPTGDATADGYLPWKTLGVSETDAWGIKRASATAPWIGYWRYRVDRKFSDAGLKFTLATGFYDNLLVQDSAANSLTTTTERPVAVIFSTGKNTTPDGHNASYEPTAGTYQSDTPSLAFDDITIWLSRPLLMNRMVAAGKLPY